MNLWLERKVLSGILTVEVSGVSHVADFSAEPANFNLNERLLKNVSSNRLFRTRSKITTKSN